MKSSIIVLTYNSEKYLTKSLDSIIENMDKTDELIIIDNNSIDNTKSLLKKYSNIATIYFIDNNIGISEGRNLGAIYSKNDLLFFIDSDIVLDKESLKAAKNSYKNNNAKALVGIYKEIGSGYNWHVEMNRELFASKRKINFKKEITFKNFTTFSGGLCLIDKKTFLKYNGFDVSFSNGPSEDIKLELLMIKDKVRIIFEKKFSATHYKQKMTFYGLLRRSFKSGIGVGNLIKTSFKHKFIIPFNNQWPYLPIIVPIEIVLTSLSFFNINYLIILFPIILLRIMQVLSKKTRTIIFKIKFLILRIIVDIIMFFGMISSFFDKKKTIITYKVIKYE